MPTGLLVRDFFKDYRELRYTSSGSIALTDIEKNAYRIALTLEVTHLSSDRYTNFKTLPENSHYGYVTAFRGSSVVENIPVKFAKQRIFDRINQGIWNYHQSTESTQIGAGVALAVTQSSNDFWLSVGLGPVGVDYCTALRILFYPDGESAQWILEAVGCDTTASPGYVPVEQGYRGFPIASPFPDLFKFKGDIPLSFIFRLEVWYLVNPTVYIADSPTDDGDETEGEDEYPKPDLPDSPGSTGDFPPQDGFPEGRDPRDFGGSSGELPAGTQMIVNYTRYPYGPGCVELTEPDTITVGYFGDTGVSFSYLGSVNGCDGASTPGGLSLNIPGAASVEVAVLQEQQWKMAIVDSVQLLLPE